MVTSRSFLGDHPLFQVPAFELRHPSELAVYVVMGLAAGLLASLLTKTVVNARIFLVRRYLAMDIILPYVAWITFLAYLMDLGLARLSRAAFPWAVAEERR